MYNTHSSSVVLQLSVAAENAGAVDQQVSLAFLQVEQTLFIIVALRLARLDVNLRYDALDHVDLRGKNNLGQVVVLKEQQNKT